MIYDRQLIAGRWVGAADGGTWPLVDPSTGKTVMDVAYGGAEDASAAVEAATDALEAWHRLGPHGRAEVLHRAADIIGDRAQTYASLTTEESGKPIGQALGEWRSAPSYLHFAAEEAKRLGGRIIPARHPGRRIEVTYRPIGVVAVIAAWNFPVYNVNRATSSALAAGCTVVIRPSEFTPRSAFAYAGALVDAGVPDGVVNVVNGDPPAMAAVFLSDRRVRKIQFTGSARVGKLLMDGASETVTKLSLELGGNAPVIVMPDADIDSVVSGAVSAKFRNAGQVCISPQRFLVHEAIADDFAERAADLSTSLVVGDPQDTATDVGPLINEVQRDRVEAIVGATVDAGARPLTGAKPLPGDGFFYAPTVLAATPVSSEAFTEEIFGPVLPITPIASLDDAVEAANSVEHGLTAFLWTKDLGTAMTGADALDYGMVGVNDWYPVTAEAPFGGTKQSGVGRESGTEGLLEYLEAQTRYISVP